MRGKKTPLYKRIIHRQNSQALSIEYDQAPRPHQKQHPFYHRFVRDWVSVWKGEMSDNKKESIAHKIGVYLLRCMDSEIQTQGDVRRICIGDRRDCKEPYQTGGWRGDSRGQCLPHLTD